MNTFDEQDLHRLVKHALDSGVAQTLDEALALFAGYSIDVTIDDAAVHASEHQAALLTTIALARRVFLGGVRVFGDLDAPLMVPMPLGERLGDAVTNLGGLAGPAPGNGRPQISISDTPVPRAADFHVRTAYATWRGGVVPCDADALRGDHVMPIAPMLAAGFAVAEAYAHVAGESAAAGRRPLGLSLWQPGSELEWLEDDGAPPLQTLPSRLWLIGLGHLGQAYLWALGLLPFPSASLELVLQDTDEITRSTESTSILTVPAMHGSKKTRAMASWAERRGFRTSIYERSFDASFRRRDDEPAVALCGVDNAEARRALEHAGFPLVIEAGLGQGHRDFRRMRLHTLPGSRPADVLWRKQVEREDVTTSPAYRDLLAKGALDRCGVTLLAGKAVGAPFVGAIAATLAVSEVLRILHGQAPDELIDLDLQSVEHRAVVQQARDFSAFNPGFVPVA
jgi:hypothetical protein